MNKEKIVKVNFEAVAEIDDSKVYGASADFNGLFQIDLKSGKSKYIQMFPHERPDMGRLFFTACRRDNCIYFFPNTAINIHCFDSSTGEMKVIGFDDLKDIRYNHEKKFSDSFLYNQKLYAIGAAYPRILILDENDEIKYIDINCEKRFLFRKGIKLDHFYYAVSLNSNILLELNLQSDQLKLYELPENFKGSWNLSAKYDKLWFLPRVKMNNLSYFDLANKQFHEVKIPLLSDLGVDYRNFIFSYIVGDELYGIPEMAKGFVRISLNPPYCGNVEERFEQPCDETIGFAFDTPKYLYLVRRGKESEYYKIDKENVVGKRMNFFWEDIDQGFISDFQQNMIEYMKFNTVRERKNSLKMILESMRKERGTS